MIGASKESVEQLAQALVDLGFELDPDMLIDGKYKETTEGKERLAGQLKKYGLGERTTEIIMRRLDGQTLGFIGEHCYLTGAGVYHRIEGALDKLSLSRLGKERR